MLAFSICVQKSRLDRVVKTASKIVGSALLNPLTVIYNDPFKELAILSQTTLTPLSPLTICLNYYGQASNLEASVGKQIASEIVFTDSAEYEIFFYCEILA